MRKPKKKKIHLQLHGPDILAFFFSPRFLSSICPQAHDFLKNNYFFRFSFFNLAALGLRADFSLAVASGGYSPVVVRGLLIAVSSLVAEHGP